MGRGAKKLIAVACLGALVASGVALASGIERRVVSASHEGWQRAYTNMSPFDQRVVLRPGGDWSYEPRSACAHAGVPWSDALRLRKAELVAPECAPFSLIGQVEAEEESKTFCIATRDHFVLPTGGKLSFAINEFADGYEDNSGSLSVEIIALDITPTTIRPEIDDGIALDLTSP